MSKVNSYPAPSISETMNLFNASATYDEFSVARAVKSINLKRNEMMKHSPNYWIAGNLSERIMMQAKLNGLNLKFINHLMSNEGALELLRQSFAALIRPSATRAADISPQGN